MESWILGFKPLWKRDCHPLKAMFIYYGESFMCLSLFQRMENDLSHGDFSPLGLTNVLETWYCLCWSTKVEKKDVVPFGIIKRLTEQQRLRVCVQGLRRWGGQEKPLGALDARGPPLQQTGGFTLADLEAGVRASVSLCPFLTMLWISVLSLKRRSVMLSSQVCVRVKRVLPSTWHIVDAPYICVESFSLILLGSAKNPFTECLPRAHPWGGNVGESGTGEYGWIWVCWITVFTRGTSPQGNADEANVLQKWTLNTLYRSS